MLNIIIMILCLTLGIIYIKKHKKKSGKIGGTILLAVATIFALFYLNIGYTLISSLLFSNQAVAIGIIGGSDGPTAIYLGNGDNSNLVKYIAIAFLGSVLIYKIRKK